MQSTLSRRLRAFHDPESIIKKYSETTGAPDGWVAVEILIKSAFASLPETPIDDFDESDDFEYFDEGVTFYGECQLADEAAVES